MQPKRNKKETTQLYRIDNQALNKILNKWDPLGVLPFNGGPTDEYKCCNGEILSLLMENTDEKELVNTLHNHLVNHWGISKSNRHLSDVAKRIIAWWESESVLNSKHA